MHSLNPSALMHINATLTGKKTISQDEVWGIHRLYGEDGRVVPGLLCRGLPEVSLRPGGSRGVGPPRVWQEQ